METLSEPEKYKLVQKAQTPEELQEAVYKVAGSERVIHGIRISWSVESQAKYIPFVCNGERNPCVLTDEYGIREQALYISKCR